MTIVNQDGIIAGMLPPEPIYKVGTTMEAIGVLHSLAYATGRPGAMAVPAGGLNGATLTTKAGQIPFTNPAGALKAYIALFEILANQNGTVFVKDRIWENSGAAVTTTTAQAITSPSWGNRDRNGAALGDGVEVGIEVTTATTNAGAITNMTLNYTNEAGTASRTGTIASFPITAAAGTFIPFQLAAGDKGVRSVEGLTLGTSLVTGAVSLVAYRRLCAAGVLANILETKDWQQLGMPELWDDTVPWLTFLPSATTAVTVQGSLVYSHG